MSTDIVKISNKAYSISQTAVDRARRRKYFTTYTENAANAPNKLSNEETKLLQDLGIDSKMINTLKLYLPTFFDNLHMCSSDTSMILHKNCNIPHYVLWSIMIANKEATDERLRQNRLKETTHQIGVAMNTAVIHQLRPTIDDYDTIFKLIVINPATQPSLNVFRLNEDPANSAAEEPQPESGIRSAGTEVTVTDTNTVADKDISPRSGPRSGPRNLSDKDSINRIFKLIISKPSVNPLSADNSEALSKQLMRLDESRRQPIYTFTQKGSTCASDALFTILLQADVIKRLFINNAEQIIRNALDNSLIHAIKRYINMLELESNHIDDRSRRKSINLTEKHGETILKTISESECSIGLSRTQITKYISNLQNKLLPTIPTIRNLFFFGGSEFKLNMENESVGKKNLNNISGFLITYPESSSAETRTGHAIAILKIHDQWYISNNENGMLEEITDPKFIPILFYKLYNTVDGEIFQLYTRYNNTYKFRFNFAGGYMYPTSGTTSAASAADTVSAVDSKRIIVFGTSENSENEQLTNIYKHFNQSDVDFKTYLESITTYSSAAAAAGGGDRIPGGIFGGDDDNW